MYRSRLFHLCIITTWNFSPICITNNYTFSCFLLHVGIFSCLLLHFGIFLIYIIKLWNFLIYIFKLLNYLMYIIKLWNFLMDIIKLWNFLMYIIKLWNFHSYVYLYSELLLVCRERSGSVVECLTRDRGAAGLSLTNITVLCP